MSSNPVSGFAGPYPVCRIGECVYLVAEADGAPFEAAFGASVCRNLEIATGDRSFVAYQTTQSIAEASLATDWRPEGLPAFASAHDLDAAELGKLVATIFRLVASSFGLRRDAVLRAVFEAVAGTDGLPRGRAVLHAVEGADIAIAEVPARFRLAAGGLLITFGDQLALGSVEAVESLLGEDGSRRLAVVDCSSPLRSGRAMALTSRGIVVAELDVRSHPDIRTFNASQALALPDAVNLLAIHDAGSRAALTALGRRETAITSVALKSAGFWFELTHSVSMPHGLFVSGWLLDPDDVLEEVFVIDHGLHDTSLTERWMLAPARTTIEGVDVAVMQFHAFLARREGLAAPAATVLRLHLGNGEVHVAHMPDSTCNTRAARTAMLDSITGRAMPPDLLERVFAPALGIVQAACNEAQSVRDVIDTGASSTRRISLIIPLYRETRFIRSQLIAFDVDPFVRAHCQIVYVVDDPLIAQRVRNMLLSAPNVFSLDIRLVILERNGGYALANNLGVGEASGNLLVLMNSDITPERPGWLEPMVERLEALPARSVIGPKLLYPDQSLQHAGMYFFRLPDIGYWQNMHFYKGYGRDFAPATVERDVPAVTGALMLLRRQDFLDVGGFTTDYVIGDYEDSDLCLKLRAAGGTCLYMASVALMHFERQSMPDSDIDAGSTIYNRALHSARWNDAILALMADLREYRHAV